MAHLLRDWWDQQDIAGRGYGSGDHAAAGYHGTLGIVCPFSEPMIVLIRRSLYPLDDWHICGAQAVTNGEVDGPTHDASQGYQYAAARVLPNGYASQFSDPIRLDFDGVGSLIDPKLPAWPIDLAAEIIAGGKVLVRFAYSAWGQGDYPADFEVYEGTDAASVDWNTPLTDSVTGLAYVAYDPRIAVYEFTTAAYGDGTKHVFGVRGRNSSGDTEANTNTTRSVTVRAGNPADAAIKQAIQRRNIAYAS